MQHDKKWLKDNNPFHAESGVNSANDFDEMACDYHEHMKAKEKEASDKFQALSIEQECKICNYTFKGLLPCKCHLRVSADVFQAVLDKHQQNIGES